MFDDNTAIREIDMISHFTGKAHFVCHQDTGHAILSKVLDGLQNLTNGFRIKRGGYLIKQDNIGLGIAKLYEVCRKLAHVPLSGYHFGGIICPKVEGVRTGMAV